MKGIKRYFEPKSGNTYCYHRKTGERITEPFGSPEFFTRVKQLNDRVERKAAPEAGTLAALVRDYKVAPAFTDLAKRTREDYQKVLDYLADIDGVALAEIDTAWIAKVRDKTYTLRKRRFANYTVSVLSAMLSFGAEQGLVKANTAKGVKRIKKPKGAPEANRPWTEEERRVVLAEAPWHLRVPIALGRYTGLREGDVIALGKTAYNGSEIARKTRKTGQDVFWPCVSDLRSILDEAPPHDAITLCANSRGKPWTESGFRASFFKFLGKLEKAGKIAPGLTFHGLRHTVADKMAELGWDNRAVADALGQATEKQAAHYTRRANLKRKMTAVVESLEEQRQKKSV